MKIRHEINIINKIYLSTTSGVYVPAIFYFDSDLYNGSFVGYFEIVAKNADSTARDVEIWSSSSSDMTGVGAEVVTNVEIPANTTNWTRLRSSSFTSLDDTEPYKQIVIFITANDDDVQVKAARLIIIQDTSTNNLTDSVCQFEVGQDGTFIPAAVNTWYPITEPKYWKYEADKWDESPTFKLGFTFECEDDKETYKIALQEDDGSFNWQATYKGTVDSLANEDPTYFESSTFTPTDGRHYRLVYQGDDYKDDIMIYNAKVIVTHASKTEITKLQEQYLLINKAETSGTGLKDFDTYYDPAEWDGVDDAYYHSHDSSELESETKLQSDPNGTPVDIAGSLIKGQDHIIRKIVDELHYPTGTAWSELDGSPSAVGQSFESNGGVLNSISFYTKITTTPTGNVYAKIYAKHNTSHYPTGSVLATSNVIAAGDIIDVGETVFIFSGAEKITLTNGNKYVAVIDYPSPAGGSVDVRSSTTAYDYVGCYYSFGSWQEYASANFLFKVWIDGSELTMPATAKEVDAYVVAL